MSSLIGNSFANNFDDEDARKNFEKGRKLATCEPGDEIVISGISGAFPESMNMRQFEENLLAKKDLITATDRRWKNEFQKITNRMGTIPEINKFDALFFGMLDKQVETMDPQGRMLLEKTYEAVVDAGYNPRQLRGKKYGVFVGASTTDTETGNDSHTGEVDVQPSTFSVPGVARSMLANRISYWLDIKGPSYPVDTACSSSIYAMDQAYRAIRSGQCDGAIVAASNLCLYPGVTMGFAELGVLSPDGKCKSFDESGDGYVRSESVVVCLLQRKKDARRLYATVVHTKTNEDGYKEEGVHYPSSAMQTKLLDEIYAECQVDPAKIAFVEAHATGTKAGDPVELKALEAVFLKNRAQPLRLGSIKSNLGHSEPSSGLNSIAKVILSYEKGLIMPNIHFTTPRKDIAPLNDGRMQVITEPTPWNGGLTGVNSFGFGGANGHVVLDSNPKFKKNNGLPEDDLPRLVTVSGRTEEAINSILNDVSVHL